MFVNIVKFPPIKEGKDEEFQEWFKWSNGIYEQWEGFISRRLLHPTNPDGHYAAIVEHETEDTFMAMHLSEDRKMAWEKVEPLLDGSPTPSFYVTK